MSDGKFKDKLKSFFTRCGEDTPPFFKKLRIVGLAIAAAGTVIATAPIALPAAVVTIGGYLIVGGTVVTTVSQTAINESENDDDSSDGGTAAFSH